jgi:nucleotide-binding universal stress UspA family protein
MFKRLLVPLDGSRFGSRALRYSAEVAHRFGAEIVLLQVIKPVTPVTVPGGIAPGMGSPKGAEIAMQAALEEEKRDRARAGRYLRGKVRDLKSRDIKASYQVMVGDPAWSVMEFADKEKIDLVVMTTHGKSGLKRVLMGSVADEVIRKSGKPVLVVRPRATGKK